jgi:Peptidase family M41
LCREKEEETSKVRRMKTKRKSEKKSIAYHEAGHAVISRVLGMTCDAATIVPDYERLEAGYALAYVERSIEDWDARGRDRWVSMFRARILMLMAGRESEIEVFGKAPDRHDAAGLSRVSLSAFCQGRLCRGRLLCPWSGQFHASHPHHQTRQP